MELKYFRRLLSCSAGSGTSLLWFTREGLALQPQLDEEAKSRYEGWCCHLGSDILQGGAVFLL